MTEPDQPLKPLVDADGNVLNPPKPPSFAEKLATGLVALFPKLKILKDFLPAKLFTLGAVLVLLAGLVWSNMSTISQLPIVQHAWAMWSQKSLPVAKHFSIAIAKLEGDEGDALRTTIMDALHDLPNIDLLRFDRDTPLANAANLQQEEARVQLLAQQWLAESKAHILIWGQVLPPVGKQPRLVRLHFSAKDAQETVSKRFTESQLVEFQMAAKEPLQAMVRAQVIAQLTSFNTSRFAGEALTQSITQLQTLIQQWPTGNTKAEMQLMLGYALSVQGIQSGNNAPLEQAVAAYREALKENIRERVPLMWAATQNNLGNALQTLGERESGSEQLSQAVTAYREALKEYTRERVPLAWAMTQNNLGTALLLLGVHEGGTEQLSQAVTAFRDALKEYTRERVPLNWGGRLRTIWALPCDI